jgi:hypothetical protein
MSFLKTTHYDRRCSKQGLLYDPKSTPIIASEYALPHIIVHRTSNGDTLDYNGLAFRVKFIEFAVLNAEIEVLSKFSHYNLAGNRGGAKPNENVRSTLVDFTHETNLMIAFLIRGLINTDLINPDRTTIDIWILYSHTQELPEVFADLEILIVNSDNCCRLGRAPGVKIIR